MIIFANNPCGTTLHFSETKRGLFCPYFSFLQAFAYIGSSSSGIKQQHIPIKSWKLHYCLLNISCQSGLTNKLSDILMNILLSLWVLMSHWFWETLVTGRQAEINTWEFDFYQLRISTYSILYACIVIPNNNLWNFLNDAVIIVDLIKSKYSLLTCYLFSLAFFHPFLYPRSVRYNASSYPGISISRF